MGLSDAWDEPEVPEGPDPSIVALKQEIMEMIMWNENTSPRSLQVSIGPSEMGDPCDRRIAYRLANTPEINTQKDPWPAIVGTAIHDWLEKAFNRFQVQVENRGYSTELHVSPDPLVKGRSDVYNHRTSTVIDWKTTGPDVMRKVRKNGPPESYVTQIQIYGLGHTRAGRLVKDVVLVFLPRSGWLDDMYIWKAPYDEGVAKAALERMYRIAWRAIELDVEHQGERFNLITATPGDSCVWCPWFNADSDLSITASGAGCPGR